MSVKPFPRLRDDLGRFIEVIEDPEPARRAAKYARSLIQRRTRLRGLDRRGAAFAPYKKSTQRRKGKSRPDLYDSGDMLNRLAIREGARLTGPVFFVRPGTRRDDRITRFHVNGTKRMAQRDYFGLTPKQERLVNQVWSGEVTRRLPKDRRRRYSIAIGR